MTVVAKICGLRTEEAVHAAIEGKARYVGFVSYPPSPRNIAWFKANPWFEDELLPVLRRRVRALVER